MPSSFPSERPGIAAALDVAAVAVFVLVGRRSHDEGLTVSGVVSTAAPFLIGLATGWFAARAWRAPAAIATGAVVWVVTVAVGLVLRRTAFDDGTAFAFVVVTALTLTVLLIGWRSVTQRWPRRRPHEHHLTRQRSPSPWR